VEFLADGLGAGGIGGGATANFAAFHFVAEVEDGLGEFVLGDIDFVAGEDRAFAGDEEPHFVFEDEGVDEEAAGLGAQEFGGAAAEAAVFVGGVDEGLVFFFALGEFR
jgi:hypothetical protein